MKTKIVIFWLSSALAQSSCTSKGYSSSQSDIEIDYFTIGSSEKRVHREIQSFNIFFDTLAELVRVILGIQEELKHDSSQPEEIDNAVFHKLSTGLSATIYAIQIIQPDPSADPTRWDLVKQKLKGVVESTTSAVSLSMNSCTSSAEIEIIENRVTNKALEICENYYNSMAIGRFNQTAVMTALKGSQKKALSDVRVVFQSTFSAIKILHEISLSKAKAESKRVLASFEFFRMLELGTLRSETGVRYDSIYTIYTSDLVGEPKIATQFSTLQSLENRQINDWQVIVDTIWNTFYEICKAKNISVTINAAKKKVVASLTDASHATREVYEIVRIKNSYVIDVDEGIDQSHNKIADAVFDALEYTQCQNCSENLAEINANEKKVDSDFSFIFSSISDVTTNISIDRPDVTAAIRNTNELARRTMMAGFHTIFDEIRLITGKKSCYSESEKTSPFFGLNSKSVAFSYLRLQSQYESGLFRKLYIVNSLYNHGINVEYSIVDTFPSET